MARQRQTQVEVEYVQPSHTKRNVAIAAAVATGLAIAAKKSGILDLKDIKRAGVKEYLAKQAEDRNLQRAAKIAEEAPFKAAAEKSVDSMHVPHFHGAKAGEFKPKDTDPTFPHFQENQNMLKAREFYDKATQRHQQTIKFYPQASEHKYWSAPFDADNPPRPGRYVHPDLHAGLTKKWRDNQVKRAMKKKIEAHRAGEFLERKVAPTEFDISIKENRNKNGQFSSANGPMITPRDMQNAYHTEPSGKLKAGLAAAGAVAGFGALVAASPGLRRKILGQAVKEVEEAAVPAADRKTIQSITHANNETRVAEANLAKLKTESEVAKVHSHYAGVQQAADTKVAEANQARLKAELLAKQVSRQADRAERKLAERDAIHATLQQIVEGKGATPIIQAKNRFNKDIGPIYHPAEAMRHVRERLVGGPGDEGLLMRAKNSALTHERYLKEAKTPTQVAHAEISHAHYKERYNIRLDQHRRLNEVIPKIADPQERTKALSGLYDEILSTDSKIKARMDAEHGALRAARAVEKANQLPKNKPYGDTVAISQRGYGAVQGRGGKKKSNNPGKKFSDHRLITLLSRRLTRDDRVRSNVAVLRPGMIQLTRSVLL